MTADELSQKARYIKMTFPFDEEMFEEYNFDTEKDEVAHIMDHDKWSMTVDLHTHKVLEHKDGAPAVYVYSKARDEGVYTLLDEGNDAICELRGYVPNEVVPPHDGWSDYIMFTVGADGNIDEWYDEYDFSEFAKKGMSAQELYAEKCPALTTDNLKFVVDKVASPLLERYFDAIALKTMEYYAFRSENIFFSHTYKRDLHESISGYDRCEKKGSLEEFMPTKSIWLYYHCANVRSAGHVTALHLFFPIYLYNDGYKLGIIQKTYPYGGLPPEEDINALLKKAASKALGLSLASPVTHDFE